MLQIEARFTEDKRRASKLGQDPTHGLCSESGESSATVIDEKRVELLHGKHRLRYFEVAVHP
jgi:hypothetical protein